MVPVMRRSMYKILHSWGQIWIPDGDESGAFPKLAMGIMDEVLGIADEEIGPGSIWKCLESFDQFYRRQKIYPVTEYGLGVPYHAEDGAFEGDGNVNSYVGASGLGGGLRHNIQGAYEVLRRRCRAPSADGLCSPKAILSLLRRVE